MKPILGNLALLFMINYYVLASTVSSAFISNMKSTTCTGFLNNRRYETVTKPTFSYGRNNALQRRPMTTFQQSPFLLRAALVPLEDIMITFKSLENVLLATTTTTTFPLLFQINVLPQPLQQQQSLATPLLLDMSSFNPASEIGDTIRTIIFWILGVLGSLTILSALYTTFLLPKQVEDAFALMKEKDYARWESINSKLKDGESILDRDDLIKEFIDGTMDALVTEGDVELITLMEKVKSQIKDNTFDIDSFETEFQEVMGMSIEYYVTGLETINANDNMKDSELAQKLISDTDREFVALLREELDKKSQK